MKSVLMIFLMACTVAACADELKTSAPAPSDVIHVATALDHLTVLEFGEPVSMAATGSTAFQIERHEDKVFVKPLKTGASTDLFVWTASRRFTYELEAPGEVKNMNFALDNRIPSPKPAPYSSARLEEIADMMFARVLVGAERVDNAGIKDANDHVSIRVEHVFQSRNTFYIHYSVRNLTPRPYRIVAPTVVEGLATKPSIALASLARTQLDQDMLRRLGELKERSVSLVRAETGKEDLQPGEETQGVVAIREEVAEPTVFQLRFGPEGSHKVQATIVF